MGVFKGETRRRGASARCGRPVHLAPRDVPVVVVLLDRGRVVLTIDHRCLRRGSNLSAMPIHSTTQTRRRERPARPGHGGTGRGRREDRHTEVALREFLRQRHLAGDSRVFPLQAEEEFRTGLPAGKSNRWTAESPETQSIKLVAPPRKSSSSNAVGDGCCCWLRGWVCDAMRWGAVRFERLRACVNQNNRRKPTDGDLNKAGLYALSRTARSKTFGWLFVTATQLLACWVKGSN